MAEMQHEKVNIKKVPMQSASYARNEERIKQDEAELAELMKQDREAKGIVDETEEDQADTLKFSFLHLDVFLVGALLLLMVLLF